MFGPALFSQPEDGPVQPRAGPRLWAEALGRFSLDTQD